MHCYSLLFVLVTSVLFLPTNGTQCYILSMQWPGTFCMYHRCKAGTRFGLFTIHGLWGYDCVTRQRSPEKCAPPLTLAQESDLHNNHPGLVNQMSTFWPNLKDGFPDMDFWSYEWHKHGSCLFANDPPLYFQSTIDIMKLIDPSRNLVDILAAQGVVSGAAMTYAVSQFEWAVFSEIHVIPFINTNPYNNAYMSEIWICADALKQLINCSATFSGGSPTLTFP